MALRQLDETVTNTAGTQDGADAQIRTADLRITNALLYQLSYIGGDHRGKRAIIGNPGASDN